MLGISFDSPEDNKAFRENSGFPYDLLCDTDKAVSLAYGVAESSSSRPSRISYLIDGDGQIKKVYESVSPADHHAEVLKDLR